MRAIHLARLDTTRPVLILTRESASDRLRQVTVAPITSTARGLPSEVPLDERNGIDHACAVSIDNTVTVDRSLIGRQIGWLLDEQEDALAQAIAYAFDLELDASPHRTLRPRFRSHPAPRSD